MSTEKVFSFGNAKLPATTAIFNMTSATDCPSRKRKLCQHPSICYAMKAERLYKEVLPYRRRQAEFWKSCTPCSFVERLMLERGKKPLLALRFSEAGDFPAQRDVSKMMAVAMILYDFNVVTYGYTARGDLNFDALRDYAVVSGSGFMLDNEFRVVEEPTGDYPVCPGDCRSCHMCQWRRYDVVEVVKH